MIQELSRYDVKPEYPLHDKPLRTMWDAAHDLFEEACKKRDVEKWRRAYKLWLLASVMRAPGRFFPTTQFLRWWLP